jgi:hypothetical protein
LIACYLEKNGRHVVLADTNRLNIERAQKAGLEAINADIYSDDLAENIELSDMGFLLALTGNDDINKQALIRYRDVFGENGSFRLINSQEMNSKEDIPTHDLFSITHDYVKITEVSRGYPMIHEMPVDTKETFLDYLERIKKEDNAISILLKDDKNNIELLTTPNELEIKPGYRLVYLGQPMDFEGAANETIVDGESI